ncbi:MAG: outer membrane protein assembly factor BamE [Methylophilaceae bacterium]|jgi:outer membrane protein assembly factor BamE|tara:strand:- start:19147 stop:20382 length:1236 start_codon:yes stop_codon:yes gene_type:complete
MLNFQKNLILFMAIIIAGCSSSMPTITPYKMDIQQGNVVTSEMLLKLRPGMTKSQVQYIMGTPLLVDSFHSDRWDYFYQFRKQGKVINQHRVILDFEGELLARVRGDVVPKGVDIDALMAEGKTSTSETKSVESAETEPVIEVIEEPVIATKAITDTSLEAVAEQEKASVTSEPMKDELLDPVPESVVEGVAPLPEVVDAAGSEQAVAKQKAMQDELAVKEALVKPPVVEAAKLEAVKLEEMKVLAPPESEAVLQKVHDPVKKRVKIPVPPVMGPVAKKVKPTPTPVKALSLAEPVAKTPKPVVKASEVLREKPVARVPSTVEAPNAAKELPTRIPGSITSERRAVLRLDRQLDAGRAAQAVPVVETLPAVESEVSSKASEVPSKLEPSADSVPNQEELGFFERALEKIGF